MASIISKRCSLFNGEITSIEGENSKSFNFSGNVNRKDFGAKSASGFSNKCSSVSCNNGNYGKMDTAIHESSNGGTSHTDWFEAAEYVTRDWRGLGALDQWNAGFITDAEEKYLKFVHHSLAARNNSTFESIRGGSGFAGLVGQRLDDALVVKEQLVVAAFTSQYFTGKSSYVRNKIISGLNSSFDHNSRRGQVMLRGRTLTALRRQFGKNSYDMNNTQHRIKLGVELVNMIREERGH